MGPRTQRSRGFSLKPVVATVLKILFGRLGREYCVLPVLFLPCRDYGVADERGFIRHYFSLLRRRSCLELAFQRSTQPAFDTTQAQIIFLLICVEACCKLLDLFEPHVLSLEIVLPNELGYTHDAAFSFGCLHRFYLF